MTCPSTGPAWLATRLVPSEGRLYEPLQLTRAEGMGFEPTTPFGASDFESADSAENHDDSAHGVPEDVPARIADHALAAVCEAWATLLPAVRAGILAMVEASR